MLAGLDGYTLADCAFAAAAHRDAIVIAFCVLNLLLAAAFACLVAALVHAREFRRQFALLNANLQCTLIAGLVVYATGVVTQSLFAITVVRCGRRARRRSCVRNATRCS